MTGRSDYLRIQRSKSRWVTPGFVLCTESRAPESGEAERRYGITVTRKTAKKAVDRNRIKRRLRALCCEALPLYAAGGADYVLIARRDALTLPYERLVRDLRWALKRLEMTV